MNVEEASKRLDDLSVEELQLVRDYEELNKKRETLLEQMDRKIGPPERNHTPIGKRSGRLSRPFFLPLFTNVVEVEFSERRHNGIYEVLVAPVRRLRAARAYVTGPAY